jgi:hypothetical protein
MDCCIMMLLIFFIGFRGLILGDPIRYFKMYQEVQPIFRKTTFSTNIFTENLFEPAFVLYASILKSISPNHYFFQVISSVIELCILYSFFKIYNHEIV